MEKYSNLIEKKFPALFFLLLEVQLSLVVFDIIFSIKKLGS